MHKQLLAALVVFSAVSSGSLSAHQAPAAEHHQLVPIPVYSNKYGEASAQAALESVNSFLASIKEAQKASFMFDLTAKPRSGWSNLPAGIVQREGISIGELNAEQRAKLFDFLSASLAPAGYQSVVNVMAAEAFLSTDKRATRLKWAPENYWLSIYGTPSSDKAWGWQFGGHHLALNIAIDKNQVESMSPSFIGTEPALFTYNGVKYRSVIDMHEAGFTVFNSLNEAQKAAADVVSIPEDIFTGPGKDGFIPKQLGVSVSTFNQQQRSLLLAAIKQWVLVQPNENAVKDMQLIEQQLAKTSFVWVGNTEINTPSYMRIQGPSMIIELLSTGGNVGSSAVGRGHYHTIYRNPNNEYGLGQ